MPTPKRITPTTFERRARAGRTALDDLCERLTNQPCPHCGHHSLVIQDPTLRTAILIYCERNFCRFKPDIVTKCDPIYRQQPKIGS